MVRTMYPACAKKCENETDSCETRQHQIDPRVLMVGLLVQPEKRLVGPDDVADRTPEQLASAYPHVVSRGQQP